MEWWEIITLDGLPSDAHGKRGTALRKRLRIFILSFLMAAMLANCLSLTAVAAPSDQGPLFESLRIEPSSVHPGETVTLSVVCSSHYGVRDGQALLLSPSGQEAWVHLHWDYDTSVLTGSFTPKSFHESGVWELDQLQLWDDEGDSTELAPPTAAGQFTLINSGRADTTPPSLDDAHLSAATVPAGGDFALDLDVTDAGSGISEIDVCFAAPRVGTEPYWYFYTDAYRSADGLWRADGIAPLDPGPDRRLTVYSVSVWDGAGNRTELYARDLNLTATIGAPMTVAERAGAASVGEDRIDLFCGYPLRYDIWAERDAERITELYDALLAQAPGADDSVIDDLNDLLAALAAAEADLFQPAKSAGVRLASPAVTGRLLTLAGAVRGRLGLVSVNGCSQPLSYAEIVAWSDLMAPLARSYEPSALRTEVAGALGEAYTDLVARGLAATAIPTSLLAAQHLQRNGWNADLLPDYVVWLAPCSFASALGYHTPNGQDLVIGLDDYHLRNSLETIDTVVHEYGHHVHDVLLGVEGGAYTAGWDAYMSMRGVPTGAETMGHDGYPSEAFAEDVIEAYAQRAVVQAASYDASFPSPVDEPNLADRFRSFVSAQMADGLPQPFRLTSPAAEASLTALPELTVRGIAAPYEMVTIWVTDELAGFLDDEYYGDSKEIRAGSDGRFETTVPLSGAGLHIIQAEVERADSLYVETAFIIRTDRRPLAVAWDLPQQTPKADAAISGTTAPGAVITVNGKAINVRADGIFSVTIPLQIGPNNVDLTVRAADGRRRVLSSVIIRDPSGQLLPAPAAQPTQPDTVADLSVMVPVQSSQSRLLLKGTAEPGSTVLVNGSATPVNADGTFVAVVLLRSPETSVTVTMTDAAGNKGRVTGTVALIGATTPQITLRDLGNHWARNEVLPLVALSVVGGYPDGTFAPQRSVTRAEFVKMLAAAIGLSPSTRACPAVTPGATGLGAEQTPFIDTVDHWADGYIQAAVRAGLIVPTEYAEGRFDPDGRITRREIAVMAVRALGLSTEARLDTGPADFSDRDAIGAASEGYAVAAQEAGIVKGFPDGSFAPDAYATRAEAAAIMNRVLGKLER